MYPGVVSRRLPGRTGTSPLDFSLTSFHHVVLPYSALLGPESSNLTPSREAWWNEVWRLTYGSMAIVGPFLQALKYATYIGGKYSSHRHIIGKEPSPTPLIALSTQQWPIIHGISLSFVLDAWYRSCAALMASHTLEPQASHGLAITVKAYLTLAIKSQSLSSSPGPVSLRGIPMPRFSASSSQFVPHSTATFSYC